MSPASHKQRSVGLSTRRAPPVSLLKTIRGRPTSVQNAERDGMDDSGDIHRQPEPGTDSDDSDAARHSQRNRDITSFTFTKQPPGDLGSESSNTAGTRRRNLNSGWARSIRSRRNSSPASSEKSGPRPDSKPPVTSNGTRAAPRAESPPSSAGSKRPADDDDEGEHLGASLRAAKKKRPSTTYGKSVHKPSQVSASKLSARPVNAPKKTFRLPPTSPQKPATSGAAFRTDPSSSSPAKTSQRPVFRKPDQSISPRRPKFKVNLADSDDDVSPGFENTTLPRRGKQAATIGAVMGAEAVRGDSIAISRESSPNGSLEGLPRSPVLVVPDLDGLGSLAGDHEEILSTQQLGFMDEDQKSNGARSELSLDDDLLNGSLRKKAAANARCPMCQAMVDPELLKKHSVGARMTIKKQSAFCRLHKRREAQDARQERGYPDIEWSALEARFSQHECFIRDILEGKAPSHFASRLGDKVESGKDRTLLKTDESLTPGYYGPRGLRAMTDLIMGTFSDTVRKRAVEDPLVSARGYTGYVQVVLVPELTVRLIMEDMSVDEPTARRIMRESRELGEFLSEEVRDVVRDSDEED